MERKALSGRVAVVTGASGRLGRLVTEAFEDEGFQVAALVRTGADARLVPVSPGSRVRSYACDATDESSVGEAFGQLANDLGRVDALVHTVGTWGATPILETGGEDWERLVRLNLFSTFLCFREAARIMAAEIALPPPWTRMGLMPATSVIWLRQRRPSRIRLSWTITSTAEAI